MKILSSLQQATEALFSSLTGTGLYRFHDSYSSAVMGTARSLAELARLEESTELRQTYIQAVKNIVDQTGEIAALELGRKDSSGAVSELLRAQGQGEKLLGPDRSNRQLARTQVWSDEEMHLGPLLIDDAVTAVKDALRSGDKNLTSLKKNIISYLDRNDVKAIYGLDVYGAVIASTIRHLIADQNSKYSQTGLAFRLDAGQYQGEFAIVPAETLLSPAFDQRGKVLVFADHSTFTASEDGTLPDTIRRAFDQPVLITDWAQSPDRADATLSELLTGEPVILDPNAKTFAAAKFGVGLQQYINEK